MELREATTIADLFRQRMQDDQLLQPVLSMLKSPQLCLALPLPLATFLYLPLLAFAAVLSLLLRRFVMTYLCEYSHFSPSGQLPVSLDIFAYHWRSCLRPVDLQKLAHWQPILPRKACLAFARAFPYDKV